MSAEATHRVWMSCMSWPVTRIAFPFLGTRDTEVGVGTPRLHGKQNDMIGKCYDASVHDRVNGVNVINNL